MRVKEVCKSFLTIVLLFFIILCCIIMFHQCSLEPEEVVEEPEEVPATVVVIPVEIPKEEPPEVVEIQTVEEEPPVEEPVIEKVVEEPEPEPEEISFPESPELDYPYVLEFYDGGNTSSDEINWDEFVYSDSELELEDGSYFGVLYVNGYATGTIDVEQVQGVTYFSRSQLEKHLKDLLTEEYFDVFFEDSSEYYPLSYLTGKAISTKFDTLYLYLYLEFDNSQMPVRNISVSGKSENISTDYSMSGAVTLQPAAFSAQTNAGLSLSAYQNIKTGKFEYSAGLSLSNQFSFLGLMISKPLSLYYSNTTGLSYSFGSLVAYLDYPELSLRLSFGAVGVSGFENGSPFGFAIEKSYSYGTDSALGNQYSQIIELEEDAKVEVFVNEKSVVNRTLTAGKYRVRDFVFNQGGNDIVVKIHPLSMGDDTSLDETLVFDTSYDSSLLGKGDSTWRFGVSIPRVKSTVQASSETLEKRGFVMPAFPSYNPRTRKFDQMQNMFLLSDFSMFWEQSIGFSDNYTQSNYISVVAQMQSNGEYWMATSLSVSGTLATKIGTSRFKIGGDMTVGKISADGGVSNLALNLSYSQSFVEPILKPLSLSLMFTANSSKQSISLNTGYSFKVLSLSVGTSASLTYNFMNASSRASSSDPAFTYNLSMSLDLPLGKKSSLSLSASMNHNFDVTAVLGFRTSLGKVSLNSSTSMRKKSVSSSISMGFSQNNNSYSFGLTNLRFDDLLNHTAAASWSHKGTFANYSFRVQAANKYSTLSYSGYISSSFAFADGHLAVTNGNSGPFILIVPQGALKKTDLSVSATMNSAVTEIRKTFGTGYYSGMKLYTTNSIIVYAGSESFLFQTKPKASYGYVAKLTLEEKMSATCVLQMYDGVPFDSASSPVYQVELDEDGVSVVSKTLLEDSYMFTDDEGRFIIDALKPGVYMFDLSVDDTWYAVFFEVPSFTEEEEEEYSTKMALYRDFVFYGESADVGSGSVGEAAGAEVAGSAGAASSASAAGAEYDISSYDSSYAGSITLTLDQVVSQDEFWNMLYGEEDVF